jgi:hypothetical protein
MKNAKPKIKKAIELLKSDKVSPFISLTLLRYLLSKKNKKKS